MPPKRTILIPVCLVLAGLLAFLIWKANPAAKPQLPPATGDDSRTSRQRVAPVADPILSALGRLRAKPGRPDALQTLKQLQAILQSLPRDQAVTFIRSFLASGRDQSTGLEFDIGTGGALGGWPTLRTFLLDSLLAIDPDAAAEISRGILTTPTTADEWALALRNIGRGGNAAEAAFLIEKTEALIANPAWQAKPSVGYLNAFDVLVHTNATDATPLLSGLIQQKDRRDLAHAGFLTLDRLVQRSPTAVLPQLAADRALQQSRPEMVAQQFARADLRDPAQQQLARDYLLDPARTPAELRSFAATYPNNNRFVSNNLLTAESQQSGTALAAHDKAVLEIVKSWTQDPAFEPLKSYLGTMTDRLNSFVGAPPPPTP